MAAEKVGGKMKKKEREKVKEVSKGSAIIVGVGATPSGTVRTHEKEKARGQQRMEKGMDPNCGHWVTGGQATGGILMELHNK